MKRRDLFKVFGAGVAVIMLPNSILASKKFISPIKINVVTNPHNQDPLERSYALWGLEVNGAKYGSVLELGGDLMWREEIDYSLVSSLSRTISIDMAGKFNASDVLRSIKPLTSKEVEQQILKLLEASLTLKG